MSNDKKIFTDSGIEIKNIYTSDDLALTPPSGGGGGVFPFTRGVQPDMYRGKLWTMRQYAGFSTAEESNQRYHYLLSQGVNGLSVAFDLPTQIGYDSDHPLADGEVGKVGVAIDSLEDMEILFKGIKLDEVTSSMTINASGFILLAFYIALAKKQGADLKKISGTIQNDILKEYAARGTYIYPPKASMRIITDIFEWCATEVPKWNTISISGYHIREAGSTAVQEIAFTLSNGKAYVQAALQKGLDINVFGKRLSFFFNAHNNLFEEVAKFRAARRMWATIMKELGATDDKAMMLRFHTQTGGSTLTAQQPYNNISRVTIQTLAAVLGGTQSLHTNGFDEALSLPTERAAGIALRTQQIVFEASSAFRAALARSNRTLPTVPTEPKHYNYEPPTLGNATYPVTFNQASDFEKRCQSIAEMICTYGSDNALKIPVYKVEIGGFDNHENQKAKHEDLLAQVGSGIANLRRAFQAKGMRA